MVFLSSHNETSTRMFYLGMAYSIGGGIEKNEDYALDGYGLLQAEI